MVYQRKKEEEEYYYPDSVKLINYYSEDGIQLISNGTGNFIEKYEEEILRNKENI